LNADSYKKRIKIYDLLGKWKDLLFRKEFLNLYKNFKHDIREELAEISRLKTRYNWVNIKDPEYDNEYNAYVIVKNRVLRKRIEFNRNILIAAKECAVRNNITLDTSLYNFNPGR